MKLKCVPEIKLSQGPSATRATTTEARQTGNPMKDATRRFEAEVKKPTTRGHAGKQYQWPNQLVIPFPRKSWPADDAYHNPPID